MLASASVTGVQLMVTAFGVSRAEPIATMTGIIEPKGITESGCN